jgi:hypothetical protein
MSRLLRRADRAMGGAAAAVLAWCAGRVEPSQREWIEALRGELDVVDGGSARLRWALGGLSLACSARRSTLIRSLRSFQSPLRTSALGLVLGAALMVESVWSNVVVPSTESDDEYAVWYLVLFVGFLVYFTVAGVVGAGRPASLADAVVTGAVTAVVTALIVLVTFVVIDNLFLDVVMRQPDKATAFRLSGMTSQRDFVNAGNLRAFLLVPPVFAAMGASCGALGGVVRRQLGGRRPSPA